MRFFLGFLPSILSIAAIAVSWFSRGVTRTQAMFSILVFSGLVLLAGRFLEGYRMYNLPFVGTAVVFAGFALLQRPRK